MLSYASFYRQNQENAIKINVQAYILTITFLAFSAIIINNINAYNGCIFASVTVRME